MSGLRKGVNAKKSTRSAPVHNGNGKKNKSNNGSGSGSGINTAGKKKASSSSSSSHACFAKCCGGVIFPTSDDLAHHYESVFSTNEDRHVAALALQLHEQFTAPTHCQICGTECTHAGTMLQHVFQNATTVTPMMKGMKSHMIKECQQMHAGLFQSFVQELMELPKAKAAQGETIEYLLSLTTPDYDEDGDDEDEDDDDDMDDYGDEDDDNMEDEPSLDELAEFQEFLSMHGVDMDEFEGPRGMNGQAAFMKQFMKQMGVAGGMGMDFDDDDDDDEEYMPKSKKSTAAKGKAESSGASGSGSSKPSGKPGELECESCHEFRAKSFYSSAQLKKKSKRRCKNCVGGANGDAADSAPSASAPSTEAATSTSAQPATKPETTSTPTATAAPSSSSSSSSKSSRHHSLHSHHTVPRDADGREIEAEPEETGDGEPIEEAEEDSEEDEDEDEDDGEEYDEDGDEEDDESVDSDEELYEDDEDDPDFDPFEMMFGGGGSRRHRRGGKKSTTGDSSKAARLKMEMHIIRERPGQLLTLDRRLRLKSSNAFPTRSWFPKSGQTQCTECKKALPSHIVRGWKLVCQKCGIKRRWLEDEDKRRRGDEEDEDLQDHHRRIRSAAHIALQASRFPNYRAGVEKCIRMECQSTQMLIVYDEVGDEWIICTACNGSKQKLRTFDANQKKLIDNVQEPFRQHE